MVRGLRITCKCGTAMSSIPSTSIAVTYVCPECENKIEIEICY